MSLQFKREFVVELYKKNKNTRQILEAGKEFNLNKMFIKRTLDRYRDTKSIKDRKRSGRPASIRSPKLIKSVREKIRRNPKRSINKLAKEHKISRTSMQRICKKDLKLTPYKMRSQQNLSEKQKEKRLTRSANLLKRLGC